MKLTRRQALAQGFEMCIHNGGDEAMMIKDMRYDDLTDNDVFILAIEPDKEENGVQFFPSTGILLVAEDMK